MTRARRSLWTAGLFVTGLALAAACGNKAEEQRPNAAYPPAASSQTAPPPAAVPAPPPATAAPGSTGPAAVPSPAAFPPPPIVEPQPAGGEQTAPPSAPPQAPSAAPLAVEQHAQSGIEIALLEVRRTSGDTVTVKWQYRNTGTAEQKVDELWIYTIADRAYLIDPANKKKYLVVRDAENTPVASDHRNPNVAPGKSVGSWAKFPAPPADAVKITVVIPNAPPFEDVPIK